jgi:hypothetical protein
VPENWMIVRIETGDGTEWCCIEFQGDILPGDDHKLGNLTLNGNEANLVLDHQILQGRLLKLEKPLIVTSDKETNTLEIVAIIRNKIIFNSRPQPRINAVV